MFTTQVTTSNPLVKAIDIDGALIAILNKNSPKWKAMKKLRKSGKMTTLSNFGESFWNTMKEVKSTLTDSIEKSIRYTALSFLQQLKIFHERDKAIQKIQSAAPPIETKMAKPEICVDFYAALALKCVEYKMAPPIILYGRLFEEERFQYVSFIFGKRVFIIEMATDISDVQGRACEMMCALIRKFGKLPKVSLFTKILRNVAHIVAEIDLPNETFTLCESVPDDLEILNLNEITDLIMASHYLSNQPATRIKDICAQAQTQIDQKLQPFLKGLYANRKNVFGCVNPPEINIRPSQHPIILVFCDSYTQSNFLWNDKPMTANAKTLMSNVKNYVASKVAYQRLDLLPVNEVTEQEDCGGIHYGELIPYTGPLVVVYD